ATRLAQRRIRLLHAYLRLAEADLAQRSAVGILQGAVAVVVGAVPAAARLLARLDAELVRGAAPPLLADVVGVGTGRVVGLVGVVRLAAADEDAAGRIVGRVAVLGVGRQRGARYGEHTHSNDSDGKQSSTRREPRREPVHGAPFPR